MKDDRILNLTKDVQWIGVLDRDIKTFDIVMETKYGTTYNAYLIRAEKVALVEVVKERFWATYLQKLQRLTDPSRIEYIIVNHTEPDHSGSMAKLLDVAPNAKVVGSSNAIRYLRDQMGRDFPHIVVKDGQTLDLGGKHLRFLNAPNLHWPDSIFTYLEEEQILFTCDVFGEHFCHENPVDDLAGDFEDAFRYYFDVILKPFSKFMLQALEKIRPLAVQIICPGHGVILRKDWKKWVDLTEQLAREAVALPVSNRVLVAYVSAYQYTAQIAGLIAQGIRQAGAIDVDLCDIEKMPLEELERKLAESEAIVLGSPTLNQNVLLQIYQVFALLNPIRDKGKLAAAFGSFGWSGEGVKIMNSGLSQLKLKVWDEGLAVRFYPHGEIQEKCIAYGKAFGEKLLAKER